MAFPPVMNTRFPRIVIVGAGMAGIAAAQRLQNLAHGRLQLTILEASERIGGRIYSSEFHGERMEFGATWIHGIEGSPIYKLATRINAMEGGDKPWEGQGGFLRDELVRTEEGVDVDDDTTEPVVDLFNDLLDQVKESDLPEVVNSPSIGAFLRNGLEKFIIQRRQGTSESAPWGEKTCRLAEGVFRSKEFLERVVTGADCLDELDVSGYREYKEYGGEHQTISKGYLTVVKELCKVLPEQSIQFKKKVKNIEWNLNTSNFPVNIHCEDGSMEQADHVLVTCSLGVLKAATLSPSANINSYAKDSPLPSIAEDGSSEILIDGGLFQPALPKWKLNSIANLGFGLVNKVFIKMDPADGGDHTALHLVMPSDSESSATSLKQEQQQRQAGVGGGGGEGVVVPAWLRKTFSIYPINKKSHVLVAWFAGSEAFLSEAQTDEDIAKGITDTLAKFDFPRGVCKGLARSKWGTNPLFRGSYSYVKNGSTCDDIDLLAEPLPASSGGNILEAASATAGGIKNHPLQLLFAGEATDRYYYSTVHGAYHSGLREADRLLQHYGIVY